MAITQTGAMYKSLSFDNTSSRSYGVYITGEAVYNAPERAVEMIAIPGRNGAFALDQGRFENIEVSYPAGIFAENESDFAQAVSDFRNFLCSKKGYCRLTDEYNPNEYRMAVYKSGLEVDPAQLRAGEFTITFECKPQRFLTSGETKTTLTSGNTITNPTLFDAHPLFELTGYGNITVGGKTITVNHGSDLGYVYLSEQTQSIKNTTKINLALGLLEAGDTFTVSNYKATWTLVSSGNDFQGTVTSATNAIILGTTNEPGRFSVGMEIPYKDFRKGTSASATLSSATVSYKIGGTSYSCNLVVFASYTAGNDYVTISFSTSGGSISPATGEYFLDVGPIRGYSTKSANGNPMYMDLEIGECWNEDSGIPVSTNNIVLMPAELPVLPSGSSAITFDNTFTLVKVVPRWWKV